jgi:hypothetical protein
MKRKFIMPLAVLFLAVLWANYTSCSSNVDFGSRGNTILGNPNNATAAKVLAAACQVISACHGVSRVDCENGLLNMDGIDAVLGLPPGDYGSASEMLQAEESGAIDVNSSATTACATEIKALSCGDSTVQGAYDSAGTNPYSGVVSMIPQTPGSCPEVYDQTYDYFVSTAGSDTTGDGTAVNPWGSISHAAGALTVGPNGATVHVASGTYNLPGVDCYSTGFKCGVATLKGGTSNSARVRYVSDQPLGAKLMVSNSYFAWYNRADYVDIVGFEIQGGPGVNYGVANFSSYVSVTGMHIHDLPVTEACASGNGGNGIGHIGIPSTGNSAVGNMVHDIGPILPDGRANNSYCTDASGISTAGEGTRIENNIIYRVATSGISSWHDATSIVVTNNLIFDIGAKTDIGNYVGTAIGVCNGQTTPATIHDYATVANNIIRNVRGSSIRECGRTGTHNVYLNNLLYSNPLSPVLQNGNVATGTITADPLMVNFQTDGSGDCRLTSSSPAIDQGTTNCAAGVSGCAPSTDFLGFNRPHGAVLDIGPYEWHP